ncbi:hypothetical protein YERFFEJ_28 [Paenibacillus phage Yyerffej]|uniref:Uncharacterized protein n=4 Tax=root TaxID=1 RepID=A0A345ARR3_9CAUD|nr:hypothetical protein HWB70_gp28 [Paenibacillus phage Yyerffej]AXF39517.1 hypothetical protein YERFFEJ_28 [Paenibacillus phage Yyerffej]QVV19900.1 hypothetical protein Neutron_25 [Paenibacillus phage Neutron]
MGMLEVEYSKILKDIIMEVREQEPTGKIEAEIWFDGRYELALHLDAANKVVDKDTSLSKFPENVDIPLSVLEDIVNLLPFEVKWVKQEL